MPANNIERGVIFCDLRCLIFQLLMVWKTHVFSRRRPVNGLSHTGWVQNLYVSRQVITHSDRYAAQSLTHVINIHDGFYRLQFAVSTALSSPD